MLKFNSKYRKMHVHESKPAMAQEYKRTVYQHSTQIMRMPPHPKPMGIDLLHSRHRHWHALPGLVLARAIITDGCVTLPHTPMRARLTKWALTLCHHG